MDDVRAIIDDPAIDLRPAMRFERPQLDAEHETDRMSRRGEMSCDRQ